MIEVLVTMIILSISLVGLAALQVHTLRTANVARQTEGATRLAQRVLEDTMVASDLAALIPISDTWDVPLNQLGQQMINVASDGIHKTGASEERGIYRVERFRELMSGTAIYWRVTVRVSWAGAGRDAENKPISHEVRVWRLRPLTQ
jgi:type II secretory pathway pseudopilin PulG